MREILVEKLVGMLVLLTCMLWAAAEKPYHDRVGGKKPDCTGNFTGEHCTLDPNILEPDPELCYHLDTVYIDHDTVKLRVPSNDFACAGQRRVVIEDIEHIFEYRHCKRSEKRRDSDYCNGKVLE